MDEFSRDGQSRTIEALRAAQLYYQQDLTMEAIAHDLGVSRSSVSRLLSHARATGLVEIQVHSPLNRSSQLERDLHDRYGVAAHVVPVPDDTSSVDRLERVAMTAARMLGQFFDSNMTLGIAWGSTTSSVSRHLIPKATHNSVIVQLNGAGNTRTTGVGYASDLLARFGGAYSAQVQQFPVPAFFDDPGTKEALWRERSTRRVLDIQARMDVILFGIGSPFAEVPSHLYAGGFLDPVDYLRLREEGVVGDVATVFYREDGSFENILLNSRATGPDLGSLRLVARRICVVSGASKARSVLGALNAGLITDLILDERLARELIQVSAPRA